MLSFDIHGDVYQGSRIVGFLYSPKRGIWHFIGRGFNGTHGTLCPVNITGTNRRAIRRSVREHFGREGK